MTQFLKVDIFIFAVLINKILIKMSQRSGLNGKDTPSNSIPMFGGVPPSHDNNMHDPGTEIHGSNIIEPSNR